MALSDCESCWDTPCSCGKQWRHWSTLRLREMIELLSNILKEREAEK